MPVKNKDLVIVDKIKENEQLKKEIEELKKENEELKKGNEVLKKIRTELTEIIIDYELNKI
jgi:cell division protein FtsB